MKLTIQASELDLQPDEIRSQIPKEKLALLEGRGELRAYRLAHEGTSRPMDLTRGQQLLKWPRAVIHRLTQKIQAGTKFFVGHGTGTNEHDGRRSVGEVVASFVKEIGGKLSSIIVGHFPDKAQIDNMDVCSMEAEVRTQEDVVGDVDQVTGVALASSRNTSPAFAGATLLSTLQCFDENKPGEGETEMADKVTFEDVVRGIKDMNIMPWQVYKEQDLRNDREFGSIFSERDALTTERDQLLKDKTELESSSKDAMRKGDVAEATKTLGEILVDGFTPKQKTFIEKRFQPSSMEDLSKEALTKHVENEKKEFADIARLFGVADDSTTSTSTKSDGDGETDDSEKGLTEKALEIVLGKKE